MATNLLQRYQVLRADSQTIKAKNISENPFNVNFADDENYTGSFLQEPARPLGRFAEPSFVTELKGLHPTQTLGTANVFSKLFKAAGMAESLTPGANSSYSVNNDPNTALVPITTLELFRGKAQGVTGQLYTCKNVVLNMMLRCVANQIAELQWDGRGNFIHNPEETTMPSLSETAGNPLRCLAASATIAGVATLSLREFEFNIGNEIILPENMVQKYGYDTPIIAHRNNISARLLLKIPNKSDFDPFELMQLSGHPQQSVTNISISITLGSYTKNKCAISAQFNIGATPEVVNQDGLFYWQISGKPNLASTAFSLTFT